jgi:glutamate racemase
MRTILICDSGLGGLDIAARVLEQIRGVGQFRLVYFNAWPHPACGYNQLRNDQERRQVFTAALEGMARFQPSLCIIACNTLSVVYRQIAAINPAPFPVLEIVQPASAYFAEALRRQPLLKLLILGTDTTVRSGIYIEQLVKAGISTQRLASVPCPGLATALETSFDSQEVREKIAAAANQAADIFPADTLLALALCCTHFGYAEKIWQETFAARFQRQIQVLNPNACLTINQPRQSGSTQLKVEFFSRFPMPPDKLRFFAGYFKDRAPELSEALSQAHCDEKLF